MKNLSITLLALMLVAGSASGAELTNVSVSASHSQFKSTAPDAGFRNEGNAVASSLTFSLGSNWFVTGVAAYNSSGAKIYSDRSSIDSSAVAGGLVLIKAFDTGTAISATAFTATLG